jgi:hypothetical protein
MSISNDIFEKINDTLLELKIYYEDIIEYLFEKWNKSVHEKNLIIELIGIKWGQIEKEKILTEIIIKMKNT